MKKILLGLLFLVTFGGLMGCAAQVETQVSEIASESPQVTTEFTTEPETEPETEPPVDYKTIKPNESGEIMIVMYHNLSERNSEYARTVESFKSDLQRLYDMGFTTIPMSAFINGSYDVPAGRTPVVLTFDDGHRTNFNYLEKEGEIEVDPNCVVAILDDFYERNPEFGRSAVFYLNAGNPFGQPEYIEEKLQYLYDNGYEIGNHAYDHEDLSVLNAEGIQKALGRNVQHFNQINSQLQMASLALPYGKAPSSDLLRHYVVEGDYETVAYHNEIVLKVGWKPTRPIYSSGFDPSRVHRVQSGDGDMQLTWWLNQYEKTPEKRFISDGLANRVSVPNAFSESINMDKLGELELFLYDPES